MEVRDLAYRLYERRLQASLSPDVIPRHVGVMCDGNRRWARSAGFRDVSNGHRKGADKIFELLDWCRETGVEVVTLWLLSTDNLARPASELVPLLKIIEETVQGLVAEHWHVNPVGALDLLPDETVRILKDAGEATAHYLRELALARGIQATRIAHGVPVGGALEDVDGGGVHRIRYDGRRLPGAG